MSEIQQLADLLNKGGLALIVAALIVGGRQGWYYWGPAVDRMRKDYEAQLAAFKADRDAWQALAQHATTDVKTMVEWATDLARGGVKP